MNKKRNNRIKGWNVTVYTKTRHLAGGEEGTSINPLFAAKENPDILSDEQRAWDEEDYDSYYEHYLNNQNLCDILATIVPKLTKNQRKILELIPYLSYKEIAERVGVSLDTVYKTIKRVKKLVNTVEKSPNMKRREER